MSKISEEPKQKACILDCYCHTEESLKEHDEENFPAIDCCEHCCKEYKQHNAWKRYQKKQKACRCICHCTVKGDKLAFLSHDKSCEHCNLAPFLGTWQEAFDKKFSPHSLTDVLVEVDAEELEMFISSQISLSVQKKESEHAHITSVVVNGALEVERRDTQKRIDEAVQKERTDHITDIGKMIKEIKQEPGVSNNLTNYAIKKLRELRERIVI